MRDTYAEISLANLRYNFLNIRKRAKKQKIMPVVKADAYGHGMIQCVRALEKLGQKSPEYYGVALLEEAIELRKSKITQKPILTFSPFSVDEFGLYSKYKILPTICTSEQIKSLLRLRLKKKLKIHVNVDTGMGRLGLHYGDAVKNIQQLSSVSNIVIDGIYTHFATSDEKDKSFAKLQLKRFSKVLADLGGLKINFGLVHTANSGAILDLHESFFDMVRPGISLYGYYPSLDTKESIKLKPVMTLVSHVSTIKKIKKGESVSYGRKFVAKHDTKIATLPIGYADGVPRNLTNRFDVVIKKQKLKQVGTVTMDRIMVDLKNAGIRTGDKVLLFGNFGAIKINAWEWCKILNTIPYEITCGISKRVPRRYIN